MYMIRITNKKLEPQEDMNIKIHSVKKAGDNSSFFDQLPAKKLFTEISVVLPFCVTY